MDARAYVNVSSCLVRFPRLLGARASNVRRSPYALLTHCAFSARTTPRRCSSKGADNDRPAATAAVSALYRDQNDTWVDRLPRHGIGGYARPYLKLARVDRPIGTLLLLWPCCWSTALASSAGQLPDLSLLLTFGVGVRAQSDLTTPCGRGGPGYQRE